MFKVAVVAILGLLTMLPHIAEASACRPAEVSGQPYSPFPPMLLASAVGNLAATFTIAKGFDGSQDFRYETLGALVLWSASGLFAIGEGCRISQSANVFDPDEFDRQRRSFLLIHALNTIPTLAFALKSDQPQRWLLFSGALVLPAITDVILRNTLRPNRVSPWVIAPTVIEGGGIYQPGLFVSYRW